MMLTMHGISTSYWDPRFGTFRPVFTHEFVHSLLAHGAVLSNHSEWFHEGEAQRSVAIDDRGFQYGDGLFETIAIRHGEPRLLRRR